MSDTEQRRWNSWDDYMHEWCQREDFHRALPFLLRGEDPAFQAYIQGVAAQASSQLLGLGPDPNR